MRKKFLSKLCINTILAIISLVFIIPILTLVTISFSNEADVLQKGYSILPRSLSFEAYRFIFKSPVQLLNSYKVTIFISILGTLTSVFIMMLCAYALTRKCFKYRKHISFFLFFTMMFHGGLIPGYILITQYLHLQNTIWVMVISMLVNVWYIFIFRSFIKEIPDAIVESAMIDGASEFRIFLSLVVPLSTPAIATIGLFVLLAYWNEWMTALLYVTKPELYPLQYLLQKTLQDLQSMIQNMDKMSGLPQSANVPSETVRMALAVVAAGPMIFIMAFFQKYFVRGMTIGSVKG